MKVTAILPDDLILEIRRHSKGKNITESLSIALREWLEIRRIKELNKKLIKRPLEFAEEFSPEKIRESNRR